MTHPMVVEIRAGLTSPPECPPSLMSVSRDGLSIGHARDLSRSVILNKATGVAMKVPFQTVDVFTDRKFGGNPLAVIPDAQGLSGEQMQSIAAEFNLAETTFVLPPQDLKNTAHV